jgi:hypothetical protein
MATAVVIGTDIQCSVCGKKRKAKPSSTGDFKLPVGWKREDNKPLCRECWKKKYLLRALTFQVASPESGTWKELDADLKVMWAQTTSASNWMMTQCYVADAHRDGTMDKLPAFPKVYLYPEARRLFPDLPPQTIVAIEQSVQRKYRSRRYDIVWTCASTLPSMRYPQPFPVHNQSWSYSFDEQGRPWVNVRIGEKKWDLRLTSGMRYRRQIIGLKYMAERGELAIYKNHEGRILVKLVGWIHRQKMVVSKGTTLIVRTGKDHLLSALDVSEERLWIENMDQLPRLIAEHAKKLQRLSEDQKAEQRPVPSFAIYRTGMVINYKRRIDSAIKEVAAHLSGFASRRKFTKVVYIDTERWLNPFPYFQLEARIKTVLDEVGIEFEKLITTEDSGDKEITTEKDD